MDEGFGLPVDQGNFITFPEPRFPVDGFSYEVYNPELCVHCEDIFVSGRARQPGEGIVGLAQKDAERGARAVMQYLNTLEPLDQSVAEGAIKRVPTLEKIIVDEDDLDKLWQAEQKIAAENELLEFKFDSDEAMMAVIAGSKQR